LAPASAEVTPVASNSRLTTTAFHLNRDATVLIDWLAANEFSRRQGRAMDTRYERIASLLTPIQVAALLRHESATVRAYMALEVVRLGQYDTLLPVLRDPAGVTDATTDVISQSTVAEEAVSALCDEAERDLPAHRLIDRVLDDTTFRPAWSGAVRCAGRLGFAGAREHALALIDDTEPSIQRSAFWALEDCATDADAARLLAILRGSDPKRRYHAAAVLEHIGGPDVVKSLEHAAQKDADKNARASAARAYAHHAEARKDVLEALVADKEQLVAKYTVDGLARRGGPDALALMVPYLGTIDSQDSLDVADAFARPPRPEWVAPMRKLVKARTSSVREAALKWLGRAHDADSLGLARKALRSEDVLERLGAISATASLGDRASISALVALLKNANPHIRLASARALTILHARGAYPKVLWTAQHDDSFHRQAMLEASEALWNGREIAVDAD
jgi:HEAT repeat protein